MTNKDNYDMEEARKRYNALPPFALIRGECMAETECEKRKFYSPKEVLLLMENGYRGAVVATEWMDGIRMGLTSIPVFMVQPTDSDVCPVSECTVWEAAKAWMDMANLSVIERVFQRIVEYNCEIKYEF